MGRAVRRRLVARGILAATCAHPGGEEVAEALLNSACHETRRRVLQSIGQLGAEAASLAGLVAARLRDPHGDVRRQAIAALGRIGASVPCVQDLVRCLRDREVSVREAAVAALVPVVDAVHVGALADCLMDTSNKVRTVVAKALPSILALNAEAAAVLLQHDAPVARREAVASLGQRGRAVERWSAALGARLSDRDGRVRRAAIRALVECGGVGDFAAPLVRLLQDNDCQEEAARALSGLGASELEALAPLLAQALDGPLPCGRDGSVGLLVRLGPRGASAVAPLLDSRHAGARAAAAFVLGLQGKASLEWLPRIAVLVADIDASVRTAAAESLASMCKGGAVEVSTMPDSVVHALGAAAEDAEASVASAALVALQDLGISERFARAAATRIRDIAPEVRAAAARALAGQWGAPFVDVLVLALRDEDPSVRSAAAGALGAVGPAAGGRSGAAGGLADVMLGDPVPGARLAACEALKALEPRLALAAVARRCGLEGAGERWVAIVGGEAALDSSRRCHALAALGSLGPTAEPFAVVVVDQLCEHDWGLRVAAAGALGALGATGCAPRLQAMQRPGLPPTVRLAAAAALRRLGCAELVDDCLQEPGRAGLLPGGLGSDSP
uniref:HEAT repeat domain-containing protein n=1 Tax=Alexandrium monilatum TaxID=311494 RepID=A0A7S4UI24_9DINO